MREEMAKEAPLRGISIPPREGRGYSIKAFRRNVFRRNKLFYRFNCLSPRSPRIDKGCRPRPAIAGRPGAFLYYFLSRGQAELGEGDKESKKK